MKIYANGCSFTWGGAMVWNNDIPMKGLPHLSDINNVMYDHHNVSPENMERLRLVWPMRLGELIGAESVMNQSMGCGSNPRITRMTLQFFTEKIENGESLDDYVAVIQFSEPNRFEVYNEELGMWTLVKVGAVIGNKQPRNSEDYRMLQSKYEYASEKQDLHSFMRHVTCLGNFFEKHNIKYMFTSMAGTPGGELKEYAAISKYINRYNWSNGTMEDSKITGMPEVGQVSEFDCHPSINGHAAIGQAFATSLKSLYPELK